MSSISFPSEHGHHTEPPSSSGGHFYSSSFDASSSFQMNPLSSHPPRTPRTSVMASSNTFSYDPKDEKEEHLEAEEDIDDETDNVKEVEHGIRKEDVWREMFLTSNGRDKAFKIIQYSIRVYLVFHTSLTSSRLLRRPTRPLWEIELLQRLRSTASGFSLTRKLLILFNWLAPLTAIMAQQTVPFSAEQSTETSKKTVRPFLHTVLYAPPPVLLELVNAIADDIATYARLGLIGKRTGERAMRFADWCWMLSTLVGLVENGVERQMIGNLQHEVENRLYSESMTGATAKSKPKVSKIDERELSRLQKQDYWLQITRAKLVMDLIFVSYDIFKITRASDTVKAFTGLAAAILSSAKIYDRHKNALLKSIMSL